MTAWAESEDGTVVIWMLGLCVVVLALGGLALDLWRAVSERHAIVAIADAAAYAGASGLDEAAFRADGTIRLDPALAHDLAAASLAAQTDTRAITDTDIAVAPGEIAVSVRGQVPLTLLALLVPGVDALDVAVTATARPERLP